MIFQSNLFAYNFFFQLMLQAQRQIVSRSEDQKCIICTIHLTKQIDLALILRQLIDSLELILKNKVILSQNITNRNAFGDLIKCVFTQKESFNYYSSVCEHIQLKNYVCSRFNCQQQQLIKAAQVRGLQVAKRMYELQLVKSIAKNSIDTICQNLQQQENSQNSQEIPERQSQVVAYPVIQPQQPKQRMNHQQQQVKLEQSFQQPLNIPINSNLQNFQFNMQSQYGYHPEKFPFIFGNQFHRFF